MSISPVKGSEIEGSKLHTNVNGFFSQPQHPRLERKPFDYRPIIAQLESQSVDRSIV